MNPQPSDQQSLAIVGAGRVGAALANAAERAQISVSLHGRDRRPGDLAEAQTVLICVPDNQIATVAAELQAELSPKALVGHASGATPLASLDPLAAVSAGRFGLHPLQTIPTAATDLSGVPCAITASSPAVSDQITGLASSLGLVPFEIDEQSRATYHAAASIASNFLFALEESAAALLARAGVDQPRRVLAPLVLSSARNWAERGAAALTGPIARGDEQTIERHRVALRAHAPELADLYEVLADRTREVAGAVGAGR